MWHFGLTILPPQLFCPPSVPVLAAGQALLCAAVVVGVDQLDLDLLVSGQEVCAHVTRNFHRLPHLTRGCLRAPSHLREQEASAATQLLTPMSLSISDSVGW